MGLVGCSGVNMRQSAAYDFSGKGSPNLGSKNLKIFLPSFRGWKSKNIIKRLYIDKNPKRTLQKTGWGRLIKVSGYYTEENAKNPNIAAAIPL